MIVKISAGISNYTGVINYHNKKVSEGKAEILTSTFGLTERKSVIDYLTQQGEKNTHAQNKGHDIPFSFNKNDVVSDYEALEIMSDYLKEMGFENYPHIIYKHDDKEHQHYHAVVSNINNEGVYNQTMRGLYKKDSQRISRLLEMKYKLTVTEYTKVDKGEKLEVKQIDHFSLHKGLMKALNTPELADKVKELIGDYLEYVKEQPQTDDYLKELMGNNFNEIEHYLKDIGVLKKSLKTSLISTLDDALINSKDLNSFVAFCKKYGLYTRYIPSQKELSFGIHNPDTDTTMYFKEKHLPIRFHATSFMKTNELKSYQVEHQKKYIKNIINQALKQTRSKEAFVQYLALRNVEVIFNENRAGLQGVGFQTLNMNSPTYFKGSEVHRSCSWNKLKEHFDSQDQGIEMGKIESVSATEAEIKVETIEQQTENVLPIDINDISRIRKFDRDEDEDERKKKSRRGLSR